MWLIGGVWGLLICSVKDVPGESKWPPLLLFQTIWPPCQKCEIWSPEKSDLYLVGADEQLNPVLRCWLFCVEPCVCKRLLRLIVIEIWEIQFSSFNIFLKQIKGHTWKIDNKRFDISSNNGHSHAIGSFKGIYSCTKVKKKKCFLGIWEFFFLAAVLQVATCHVR